MMEWALLSCYMVAGVGLAGALGVWWASNADGEVDVIDGTYLAMVGMLVAVIWPLVLIGAAVARLVNRMPRD